MRLLEQMLKYDAADLDMNEVVSMFRTIVTTFPVTVFTVLPPSYHRDAQRLARTGHITLPKEK